MGADFICSYIDYPEKTNLRKAKNLMLAAADKYFTGKVRSKKKASEIINLQAELGIDYNQEVTLKERCKQVIRDAMDTCIDLPRDCGVISIGYGKKNLREAIITGGTTWGDDPTDSFNIFCEFHVLPSVMTTDILK